MQICIDLVIINPEKKRSFQTGVGVPDHRNIGMKSDLVIEDVEVSLEALVSSVETSIRSKDAYHSTRGVAPTIKMRSAHQIHTHTQHECTQTHTCTVYPGCSQYASLLCRCFSWMPNSWNAISMFTRRRFKMYCTISCNQQKQTQTLTVHPIMWASEKTTTYIHSSAISKMW